MPANLADQLFLAPDVRMTAYAYRELCGRPPTVVWQVPGTVTLLADGPRCLTVATRWGAIAAAAPRPDSSVELIRMDRPGERSRLTLDQAAAGDGPPWAGSAPRSARAAATVLVSSGLPAGSGLGAAAATEKAIALCLHDVVPPSPAVPAPSTPYTPSAPHARLGNERLPFDLDAAGLRLAVIDTRVRGVPRPPVTERAAVQRAAAALNAGRIEALGPLLTAAHQAQPGDDVQDIAVSVALSAGALGARAITDGPGRPVCALLPVERLAGVRTALVAAFTRQGLRAPRLITLTPADAPQRTSG